MHSAIFIASPPKQKTDWGEFLTAVDAKLKDDKETLWLAENVWFLGLRKSAAALGWLIAAAEARGIVYGILPFERAPEWLPGDFDPKTIRGQRDR